MSPVLWPLSFLWGQMLPGLREVNSGLVPDGCQVPAESDGQFWRQMWWRLHNTGSVINPLLCTLKSGQNGKLYVICFITIKETWFCYSVRDTKDLNLKLDFLKKQNLHCWGGQASLLIGRMYFTINKFPEVNAALTQNFIKTEMMYPSAARQSGSPRAGK